MNETIIRNHNQRVKPEDTLIHIGDFCLAGKTNILTPNGPRRISTLKAGNKVYSVNVNWKNKHQRNKRYLQESTVIKTFITNNKSRLHLYLSNGTVIKVTDEHPFAVSLNGKLRWVLAKNLKKGNILFLKSDIGEKITLIGKKHHINYKLGYIIGYALGDGNINKDGIRIESKDYDGLKRITTYIDELYGIKIKISNYDYYRINIPRKIFISLFENNITYKPINKAHNNWYIGFISGFFDSEGSCTYQSYNWFVTFCNTNKKLYDYVRKLISYFGFYITKTQILYPKGYKKLYYFKLKTSETFNFFVKFKPAIKRKYPNLSILSNGVRIDNILKTYSKNGKSFMNYNLMVSPNNNYFADGVLVHNCFKNSPGGKPGEGTIIKSEFYEKQLNGKIIFLKGNHDKNNSTASIIENMTIRYGGMNIYLVHRPNNARSDFMLNLVGHVHDKWKACKVKNSMITLINVGVDQWNFMPIDINEILSYYSDVRHGRTEDKIIRVDKISDLEYKKEDENK